jgi:glycosyltransferase involved in cell wall biosynthesis
MSTAAQRLNADVPATDDGRWAVLFTSSYCMGGIEAHLGDLAEGLIGRGWRVALICSGLVDIEPLRQAMRRMGADVWAIPDATNAFGLLGRIWRLYRVLRGYPDAVVHLHLQGEGGGILVLLAAKFARAAAVVRTLHNPPVLPITPRGRVSVAISARLLDRVICVSPETHRVQMRDFSWDRRKLAVIPNGVDLGRFSPSAADGDQVRRELGVAQDAPLVGTVARLQEERKGISQFISMAAQVAASRPDAHFMVVGDGPLRPALERQAAESSLGDRIHFTGYRRDVPSLLAAMNVAVFPSSYEAAQYVMLEAMAMAVPVVSTPAGLATELIAPRITGMLVPIHDTVAMTGAVVWLIDNPQEAGRVGIAGRALIERSYSSESMIDSIACLYRDVIAERQPVGAGRPSVDLARSPRSRSS